jgi:hypothetical protein
VSFAGSCAGNGLHGVSDGCKKCCFEEAAGDMNNSCLGDEFVTRWRHSYLPRNRAECNHKPIDQPSPQTSIQKHSDIFQKPKKEDNGRHICFFLTRITLFSFSPSDTPALIPPVLASSFHSPPFNLSFSCHCSPHLTQKSWGQNPLVLQPDRQADNTPYSP